MRIPSINVDPFLCILVVATCGSGYVALETRDSALQGFFGGIAASGLVGIVALVSKAARQQIEHRMFGKFFGRSALDSQMHLVYPDFMLSKEAEAALLAVSIDRQAFFAKRSEIFLASHRVDIPSVVAANDIESLLHAAIIFGEVMQKLPPIRSDSVAVANPGDSFVSFGFSSNECTHMYLNNCQEPLFRIVQETVPQRYGEYLEVSGPDRERVFRSSEQAKMEIAIIVRHQPDIETADGVVWFLCGGLGPLGTVGAGYYLATRWKELHNLVGERDFLCVLSVATWSVRQIHRLLIIAGREVVYEK
jgi:hypothetical protein